MDGYVAVWWGHNNARKGASEVSTKSYQEYYIEITDDFRSSHGRSQTLPKPVSVNDTGTECTMSAEKYYF